MCELSLSLSIKSAKSAKPAKISQLLGMKTPEYIAFKLHVVPRNLDRRRRLYKVLSPKIDGDVVRCRERPPGVPEVRPRARRALARIDDVFSFQFIVNKLDSISVPMDVTDISHARIEELLQEGGKKLLEGGKKSRAVYASAEMEIREHFKSVNETISAIPSCSGGCSRLQCILQRIIAIQFRIAHAFATDPRQFSKTVSVPRVDNVCRIIVCVLKGHFGV
jgi:hypothetical protein